jgi:hypothetical protein
MLPWWAWLAVGVLVLVAVGVAAARSYRASLRRGLREYLRGERPHLHVVEETSQYFRLADEAGNEVGTLNFQRLYEVAPRSDAERLLAYSRMLGAIDQAASLAALTPADRHAVRPRILHERALAALQASRRGSTPSVPLGVCGLHVVLVLDGEHSVAYLGQEELALLGTSLEEGMELAKANLFRSFDPQVVQRALRAEDTVVVRGDDTYDATRLLLVPQLLSPGDEIAAAIPDRDTLVLLGSPNQNDWALLEDLARTAEGDPLCAVPLRVTHEGITARPGG